MKKRFKKNITILLSALLLFAAGFWNPAFGGDAVRPYIVVFEQAPVQSLRSFSASSVVEPADLIKEQLQDQIKESYPLIDGALVDLTVEQAESLASEPGVAFVEPDYPVHALSQTVPWGVEEIYEEEIYPFDTWTSTSGAGIRVAVLDSGIQNTHEDLPALAGGFNTVEGSTYDVDGNGHGTHVAGIVAAQMNDIGVVGVAPAATLYSVKVLDENGHGWVSDIIDGIDWAVENHIDIISMSLGMNASLDEDSMALETACNEAYAAGLLLIAAAGNSGTEAGIESNINYPAAFDSVIAVGATDSSDKRADFSATGTQLELMAPGHSILSTYPGATLGTPETGYDLYRFSSGTSMATPHVSGAAAVIWSLTPSLSNVQVREILQTTALDLGLLQSQQGYGLIQLNAAVDMAIDMESGNALALAPLETALRNNTATGHIDADLEIRIMPGAGVQGQVFFALYDSSDRMITCRIYPVNILEYKQSLTVSADYDPAYPPAKIKAFLVTGEYGPLSEYLEVNLP